MGLFATPDNTASDSIDWKTLVGTLLIIKPLSIEKVQTRMGEKEAVKAQIWAVDGPAAPDTWDDALIFPRVLIGQTKNMIGQLVLGRVGQGTGKPGQNPPWILNDPTAQDEQTASAAWEKITANQFATPTPAATAPTNGRPF